MNINSLAALIERGAAEHSENIAVIDGARSLTYAEFRDMVMRAASGILKRVAGRSSPIFVFMPKSADCVVCFIAALYSGNIYVPGNADTPTEGLRILLEELRPELIVADAERRSIALEAGFDASKIVSAEQLCGGEINESAVLSAIEATIDASPAYIIYTSGSTGTPKGAAVSHRGVIDYAAWVVDTFRLDKTCVLGLQSGFHFDNSTFDIYGALLSGGTLHIIPDRLFMYPRELPAYLAQHGITTIFWVPSMMIAVANSGALERVSLPMLSNIVFAGEVMPARTLNLWRKFLPNAVYANLYGPTEITVDCTCYIVDREFADSEPIPIGRPRKNMHVLLIDEAGLEAETGELCVIGSAVALGYWNRFDLTAEAFVQNPLNSSYQELIYRTGDLARWAEDGNLMFLGRRDHQIKIGGIRIELGEVEAAAINIPDVRNCCALFDDEAKQIILIIECDADQQLRRFNLLLSKHLPRYMLPKRLITVRELPLTPNRKIDRTLLALKIKNGEL